MDCCKGRAAKALVDYFGNDFRRITHALEVLKYSERLMENAEGGDHDMDAGCQVVGAMRRSGLEAVGRRSTVHLSQRRAFVHRDVIGLIAFDFILRIIRAGVVRMSLVIYISCMHLNDLAADASCFGVPGHVVADFELFRHGGLSPVSVALTVRRITQQRRRKAPWPFHSPGEYDNLPFLKHAAGVYG